MKHWLLLPMLAAAFVTHISAQTMKVEDLPPDEKVKYKDLNKYVRKLNPALQKEKDEVQAAYREAMLRLDPTVQDFIDLKKDERTDEQNYKYDKAKHLAEANDPTLKERNKANKAAIEEAMLKTDPEIEPILNKLRKPAGGAAAASSAASSSSN